MFSAFACCTARDGGERLGCPAAEVQLCMSSRQDLCKESDTDEEDGLEFFECASTWQQLARVQAQEENKNWSDLPTPREERHQWESHEPEVTPECLADCDARDCIKLTTAVAVLERTREQWKQKVNIDHYKNEGPEMDWATLANAKRMLKANFGDTRKAVEMFLQALEFRARDRRLYETMKCQVRSDMRIIGRDIKCRPLVYMCAKSQTEPLKSIRDQFVLTFEAACSLTSDEGQVFFVCDMHGLRPKLNMDARVLKELSDTLGTVYADRIYKIIVVDFSVAAQAAWWVLKPFLSPPTRQKFYFLNKKKSLEVCRGFFSDEILERVATTMEMNRDPKRSREELNLHARRTTLCSVPLGPPLKT